MFTASSEKCYGIGEIWMECGCNKSCDNWHQQCPNPCLPGCYCLPGHARLPGLGNLHPCIPVECCPIETCVNEDCDQNNEKCELYLSQL